VDEEVSSFVLDSSVLLAVLKQEPGASAYSNLLSGSLISAVNAAECISVLIREGGASQEVCSAIDFANVQIVTFDRGLAERAGALIALTKRFGLSLGDRACLALAAREKLPALTADRIWQSVDVGVEIRVIR
jgi:PIN domain nuclease of toxin-antitoxin system